VRDGSSRVLEHDAFAQAALDHQHLRQAEALEHGAHDGGCDRQAVGVVLFDAARDQL
jgi:hypothetical protein